jgi:hypothetical protein
MTHEEEIQKKIYMAELSLYMLLGLVFSGYSFEEDNLDNIQKKESEKIIGQVKLKSTKRLWYFISVLKSALLFIKNADRCEIVRYHLKILESLFRLAVSEEVNVVVFCESRVVQGWQVVTGDDVTDYEEIKDYFPYYYSRLQNLFIGSMSISYDVSLKAPRIKPGDEVLGGVKEAYIRIYSLKDDIIDFDEGIVRSSEKEISQRKIDFFHNLSEYLASVCELINACFICFVREQVNCRFDDERIRVYEDFRIVREKEIFSFEDVFAMECEETIRYIDDHFESLCLAADPGKDGVDCPVDKILLMCKVVES